MAWDIPQGGRMLSIGVTQVLLNLAFCSAHHPDSLGFIHVSMSAIGYIVTFIGYALYTANGILSIIHYTILDPDITVIVTLGCGGGESTTTCATIEPDYTFTDTSCSPLGFGLWVAGYAIPIVLFVVVNYSGQSISNYFKTISNRKGVLGLFLGLNILYSVMAVVNAGLRAISVSESFLDCRNGNCIQTQIFLPGSVSGFWKEWVLHNEEVIKSIFLW
jgi:hypothetical protein